MQQKLLDHAKKSVTDPLKTTSNPKSSRSNWCFDW